MRLARRRNALRPLGEEKIKARSVALSGKRVRLNIQYSLQSAAVQKIAVLQCRFWKPFDMTRVSSCLTHGNLLKQARRIQ